MYEQFTDYVHKVMLRANNEARGFNHEYIGPEHVLLALTKSGRGIALNVLKKLGVDVQQVGRELEKSMQRGPDQMTVGKLPLTPEMKHVMEFAVEEARQLNHRAFGTQHLLLGLLRDQAGMAPLGNTLGVTLEDARAEISQLREEDDGPGISPSDPDHDIRRAMKSIWLVLPEEIRNVEEVERQIRRLVDRALRDFRDDFEKFFRS